MNWLLLQNSLLVSAGATLLALVFGLVVALAAAGLSARNRNCLLGAAVVALGLPPFLVTNAWLHFLGGGGVWRAWLPVDLMSLSGATWLLALLYWPITSLLAWAAWQRLDPALLEAEPAARGWPLVRWVLLPQAQPALAQAALLTFVLALNNFTVPAILQVKVFPAELWVRFSTELDPLGALKLGWPLIIAPLLVLAWLTRRTWPWPNLNGGSNAALVRRQLGVGWWLGSVAGGVVIVALSVGLPVGQILCTARTWVDFPLALTAGHAALWTSVWSAAGSATLAVGLALVVGQGSRRQSRHELLGSPAGVMAQASSLCDSHGQDARATERPMRLRALGFSLRILLWLPFLVPGVLLGVALIACFNRPLWFWLYRGVGVVLLALVLRYFVLGWSGVRHAIATADSDLADVARTEGASRWQMFRWVLWPQIAPQVCAAWYVVYLLCLWDVESLVLIMPPGGETLALRVFNLLHYGHNAQVNALCLMLLLLALAPWLAWSAWRLLRKSAPRLASVSAATGLAALAFLSGCGGGASDTESRLKSELFERAVVLGTRGTAPGQFNKPRSIAVDSNDNFYVTDMTGRVQKLAPDGRFLLQWQMPVTDLGKPKGLTRDRAGNMVVVEPHYQRVNHFSPAGQLVAQWGIAGTNTGQLRMPRAVAMNSHGEFYLPEYGVIERVQRFAGTNGTFLNGFGTPGTGPGEFNRAEGIAVDRQDRVYVADSCNHRIQVFDREGKFLRQFGKPGSGAGELSYPYDVCVDAEGRVYVCEFGNSRVQIFDNAGRSLEIIGQAGYEPGRFNNPWGCALDSHGNLYVADALNHRVQKLMRRASH